jgi:hypothetical protein
MSETVTTQESTLDISTATIRVTVTRVRPSIDIPWFEPTELWAHMTSTYNNTGKRWNQVTDSEDGLTKRSVTYWVDWLTWQDANMNDPIMMEFDLVTAPAYGLSTGIVRTTVKEMKINGEWVTMPVLDSVGANFKRLRLQELKGS